jgi:hypothetical protein
VVTTAEWCTERRSEEPHYQAIRELIALCVREAVKKSS